MKKIRIICEEAYVESIWSKQLTAGLFKELKKHRISFEQTAEAGDGDAVCMIGNNRQWLEEKVEQCQAAGVTPVILSSLSAKNFSKRAHLVCADVKNMAAELKKAMEAAGRTKVALYGGNASIDLDRDRMEHFFELLSDKTDIYPNTGNLEQCFRTFLPKAHDYDAVVCVNGYAAVSLVKKLEKENPKLLESLMLISFEEVLKHSKYNEWISLTDYHLEAYGSAAYDLLEITKERKWVSKMTVEMQAEVCEIQEKCYEAPCSVEKAQQCEDPELICMARMEQLLCDADDLDHHIIAMLLDGATYVEIAESCYMTEGNIKYRVKKYMSICDCRTKKELLELLREYLR